jgi:flavin reductase (DIM6/NTAB) family NADH-FMN oxidoreductase RutF
LTERTRVPAPVTLDSSRPEASADPVGADPAGAWEAWAAAVTLVTVADGRDDVGATVSAFCPVSADPPLVLVSLMAGSYPAELFGRRSEPVTRFAVTLLAAGQRMLAGRFAAAGRPGARRRLDALECDVQQVIRAGDHLLILARVTGVPYVTETGEPLIRFRRHYLPR